MTGAFQLAWRFVAFHRVRSAVLVTCLAMTMALPVGLRLLVVQFEKQLAGRSRTTPLVAGAVGSRFDLILHTLYFRGQPPAELTMQEVDRITQSGYAEAVPIFARFRAAGFPVVGTTSDYLKLRELRVNEGTGIERHGDCLVGQGVARQLQLGPGDSVLTEPELAFGPDGSFPLKLRVTGVLAASSSPDDNAIFVEIYTAWIVAGIGHGHAEGGESTVDDQEHDPGLIEYTEITDSNVDSFHFHGDRMMFPVTSIIVLPSDDRAETLLLGRYLDPLESVRLLKPEEVIDELLEFVIQLRKFFDLAFLLLAIITSLFVMLVIALSLKLRQREFQTMHRIGCSRSMVFRLIAAELVIVTVLSFLVFASLQLLLLGAAPHIISHWLRG